MKTDYIYILFAIILIVFAYKAGTLDGKFDGAKESCDHIKSNVCVKDNTYICCNYHPDYKENNLEVFGYGS